MTFIALFVALMLERFFDFSHVRIWHWYAALAQTIVEKTPQQSSAMQLAWCLLPLMLIVGLVQALLFHALYGFPLLLFNIALLLFCLGPRNLWADAFFCVNHLEESENDFEPETFDRTFGIRGVTQAQRLHQVLLQKIIEASNGRVFAIVFWYFVLGPVGAIAYRLSMLLADSRAEIAPSQAIEQEAQRFVTLLDWLPARLFTLFFALGGNFMRVFEIWRRQVKQGLDGNNEIISSCGVAALGYDDHLPSDGTAERNAIGLIDRSLVIVLVLVSLLVFVF